MRRKKIDIKALVDDLTELVMRNTRITGGPHAYNHIESVFEKHIETVLRKHGVTSPKSRKDTSTRECLHPDCTNHISDRNRSGVCTRCWHNRPDWTAKVWDQITSQSGLTINPNAATMKS